MSQIIVVGCGTMGLQIAMQFARFGLEVTLYDSHPRALTEGRKRMNEIVALWLSEQRMQMLEVAAMRGRITWKSELDESYPLCELLIESVPEIPKIKADVYAQFQCRIPDNAIIATNSSYLTPSMLLRGVRAPERFAALHFHDPVWHANVVDVMPHRGTSREVVDRLVEWALKIDQIPIVCRKERIGYVFNAMLQAFLKSALELANSGVAEFDDIDRAWMAILKTDIGPFGILDRIGLDTVRTIATFWASSSKDAAHQSMMAWLEELTTSGRLGVKSGEGFYRYPSPAYQQKDFLRSRL